MPSNIWSGRSVSSTRSLNVPGSPSSALHNTYRFWPGALRANSHFIPVAKPAPPRPRSRDARTSATTSSGVRRSAASSPAGDSKSEKCTGPRRRRLLRTIACTSGCALLPSPSIVTSCAGSRCRRSSRTTCRPRSGVRFGTTTSLTSAAGAWSLIPMHGVCVSVSAPSAVVSPIVTPSSFAIASATSS